MMVISSACERLSARRACSSSMSFSSVPSWSSCTRRSSSTRSRLHRVELACSVAMLDLEAILGIDAEFAVIGVEAEIGEESDAEIAGTISRPVFRCLCWRVHMSAILSTLPLSPISA